MQASIPSYVSVSVFQMYKVNLRQPIKHKTTLFVIWLPDSSFFFQQLKERKKSIRILSSSHNWKNVEPSLTSAVATAVQTQNVAPTFVEVAMKKSDKNPSSLFHISVISIPDRSMWRLAGMFCLELAELLITSCDHSYGDKDNSQIYDVELQGKGRSYIWPGITELLPNHVFLLGKGEAFERLSLVRMEIV